MILYSQCCVIRMNARGGSSGARELLVRDLERLDGDALPVELNDGPVHFDGQALVKFQRSFSAPLSSSSTIEPLRRSALPSITVWRHFHSSSESVMPRLSEIALKVFSPGSLRTCLGSSPSR